jgi:hypothetical protein
LLDLEVCDGGIHIVVSFIAMNGTRHLSHCDK